jgi:hypothetical protein
LQELADMHHSHQALTLNSKKVPSTLGYNFKEYLGNLEIKEIEAQKSLPAFVVGGQIAVMCKKLEKIQCRDQNLF